jgi:hypothetical protein
MSVPSGGRFSRFPGFFKHSNEPIKRRGQGLRQTLLFHWQSSTIPWKLPPLFLLEWVSFLPCFPDASRAR